jgi:RHS repeat-associated protein
MSLKTGTALVANYTYDGFQKLRVKVSTSPAATTHYVWDSFGHIIADTAGTFTREYIWLGDTPLAINEGATLSYVHPDHLDRPVAMTTSGGPAIAWSAKYDPFGNVVTTTSATAMPLRFPGQYFQIEDGLSYNWHRNYDPTLGRYSQADPLGFVDGPGVYSYVGSSPAMKVDPRGLWTVQIRLNININLGGPLVFSGTIGIAFDGCGNVASYHEYGGGVATGSTASGGLVLHASNGDTIGDLNGPFNNVTAGGGWGPHASGDGFFGFGSHGQRVVGGGITIGYGVGGSTSETITKTDVAYPIYQP